jgi:acyl carrier protein
VVQSQDGRFDFTRASVVLDTRRTGRLRLEVDVVTTKDIYGALRDYVASELLQDQSTDLDGETPLLEWSIIDSLTIFRLIAFIEDRFAVSISHEDLNPEHFKNLTALSEHVTTLCQRAV